MIRDTDPPLFFRRVWQGATQMDEVTVFSHKPDGSVEVLVGIPAADLPPELAAQAMETLPLAADGLVIYGRAVWSDDPDDQEYILAMRERGQVFAECFSEIETVGELGTHPLAVLTEISREEFESARSRGWK